MTAFKEKSPYMQDEESSLILTEQEFFNALTEGDVRVLERLLADEFLLIDVLSGSEITKAMLISVVDSGQLKFNKIDSLDLNLRVYECAAVSNGTTEISGHFGPDAFQVASRYTHVYVKQKAKWQLVSAQGTKITS